MGVFVCVELTLIIIGLECCVPITLLDREKSQRIWLFFFSVFYSIWFHVWEKIKSFHFSLRWCRFRVRFVKWISVGWMRVASNGVFCEWCAHMHTLSGNDLYLLTEQFVWIVSLSMRENSKVIVGVLCHTTLPARVTRWTKQSKIKFRIAVWPFPSSTIITIRKFFSGCCEFPTPNFETNLLCETFPRPLYGLRNWFNNAAAKIGFKPLCIWMFVGSMWQRLSTICPKRKCPLRAIAAIGKQRWQRCRWQRKSKWKDNKRRQKWV